MLNNKKIMIILLSMIGLLGLSSCQKNRRIYNPVTKKQTVYQRIQEEYAPLFSLFNSIESPESKQKLKNHILFHNDSYNKDKNNILFSPKYKDLPFMQYKNILDQRISQLKEYVFALEKKSNKSRNMLKQNIQGLIEQLEYLNKIILTMDDYHQEKIKAAEISSSIPFKILTFGLSTIVKKIFFA